MEFEESIPPATNVISIHKPTQQKINTFHTETLMIIVDFFGNMQIIFDVTTSV